jgi:hypothetical protein
MASPGIDERSVAWKILLEASNLVYSHVDELEKLHGPCPAKLHHALMRRAVLCVLARWPEKATVSDVFPPAKGDLIWAAWNRWMRQAPQEEQEVASFDATVDSEAECCLAAPAGAEVGID